MYVDIEDSMRSVLINFREKNKNLSREETEKRAEEKILFDSLDWLWLNWACRDPGTFNLKVVALTLAIKRADSLEDWVRLAGYLRAPYRNQAFEMILTFDLETPDAVGLLLESGSERLQSIGWYLQNR